MTITAKVIADSISFEGIRLTTLELYYPWMIHPEFMTHRVLSRNAGSSRAVPVKTMIRNTLADMAMPARWGSNKAGMQAGAPLEGARLWWSKRLWRSAGYVACGFAWALYRLGAHKQIANRVMMPWMHIKVVVTSTDWANWFALRDHPDADPTIEALAQAMDIAMRESKPKTLQQGEWHLPYIYEHERNLGVSIEQLLRSSAARCARVSYLNFDGSLNFNKDNKLFAQLVESKPVHASPTEHQATPDRIGLGNLWAAPEKHGNFFGWCQHRKMIEGEAVHDR